MKNSILKLLRWLYNNTLLFFDTFVSLIRVLMYSKLNTHCSQLYDIKGQVYVLGNGPSLRKVISDNIEYLGKQNLVVVNDFFLNRSFIDLKPKVYVISDPAYWEEQVSDEMNILRKKMLYTLLNAVDWNMLFFIPTDAYRTDFFQNEFRQNSHLFIQPYNATSFFGNKRMRYFFYNKLLSKPFSGNVIGSALFISMQMDIKKIFLFGVEHSWTQGLYVDDENRTCIRNEHFYSLTQEGKVWLKSNSEPYKIHEALSDISKMLSGYCEINEYAIYKDIKIYNCTPNSFIDVFERKKLDKTGLLV